MPCVILDVMNVFGLCSLLYCSACWLVYNWLQLHVFTVAWTVHDTILVSVQYNTKSNY